MNIYAFIPLIATLAYIPLLMTTLGVRPLRRQHKLFLLFLIAAMSWSLVDYIFRSNFFPGAAGVLIRVIILLCSWMAVQFHFFSSSFFPANKSRWLPVAYGSLLINIVLASLNLVPQRMVLQNGILLPEYGWGTLIIAVPLLVLAARNIYILRPRMKDQNDPIIYNQTASLLICLLVLIIFILSAILPFAKAFPIAHVGNIIVALILSYAVVGHQLADIRLVLRRGFIWISISVVGIASFWGILLLFHEIIGSELTLRILYPSTVAGIIAVIVIFQVRDLITRLMGRAFQGESFYYRQKLNDFANKIQNIFSLKEQEAKLLKLIIRAIGCSKARLLFLDPNGDLETQLADSDGNHDMIGDFKLKGDNPIVEYIKKEQRVLTRESLDILPEFLGIWQQEKRIIDNNGIELFVPLISRGRLIGLLVTDKKKNGYYNLEDYALLEEITKKVSVSMEKEFLREKLREREQELSVINRSNAIISSSLDIQRIYDNFIKELKNVVDIDWAAINVIEDSEIHFMAVSTEIGSPWKVGERIPLKGTATDWVAIHHKPLIENDLSNESYFDSGKYYLQHSLLSIAVLPLLISNRVIGSLTVASRKPNAYNDRHIKLLDQLGSQISISIENARLYAKTERMARVDSLTGLLNRRSLDEILSDEIGRHFRYGGVFSIIIFDLDSFKSLNDTFGHLAGDELLRQIGVIVSNAIRESDRAFRYGGDEFAIILPETSLDASLKVAERIRQQTYATIELGSKPVSISVGLSSWPADGIAAKDVLAAADSALYQAKRSGGNRSQCSVIQLNVNAKDENNKSNETPDSHTLSNLFAMANTVDVRNKYCSNHSKRVHEFSVAIGNSLGMKPLELDLLGICALLHDIGKIGISDEILNKQEVLSENEWEVIKSHPALGAAIISHSVQLEACIAGILHHHEKYDGSGYPDALKGEEIPLESRIVAIADAFAAMTSARVYSKELTYEAAIAELKSCAGVQFDPKLVKIFIETLNKISTSLNQSK